MNGRRNCIGKKNEPDRNVLQTLEFLDGDGNPIRPGIRDLDRIASNFADKNKSAKFESVWGLEKKIGGTGKYSLIVSNRNWD